jgi:hypothetical protein
MSTLSLIASASTLVVVLVGAKKAQSEIETMKTQASMKIRDIGSALSHFEL